MLASLFLLESLPRFILMNTSRPPYPKTLALNTSLRLSKTSSTNPKSPGLHLQRGPPFLGSLLGNRTHNPPRLPINAGRLDNATLLSLHT